MKKSILLAILCAGLLIGCGQSAESAATTETTTVSQVSAVIQAENTMTTTTLFEDDENSSVSMSQETMSVTITQSTRTLLPSSASAKEQTTTTASQTTIGTSQPAQTALTTATKEKTTTTKQPAVTTTTSTTTKHVITTTTTQKLVTTTTATTTAVTTTTSQDDVYLEIGRNLSHDGTDYGKAKAVYDWMNANGSGTCVNYAYKTCLLCEGIGLDCYICWTDAKLYGHVANVVKVDGVWYVLDAQGGFFLHYNYGFTEVVDSDENHVADGSIISDDCYGESYG